MYELVARYIVQTREFMQDKDKQGEKVGKLSFDAYPSYACEVLVNGFQGHLMSPAVPWFTFAFVEDEPRQNPDNLEWLEKVTWHIYEVLSECRFYDAAHDATRDCAAFGTTCVYCEDDLEMGTPLFITIPLSEVVIAVNRRGVVDTVYRRYWMTAAEMVKEFGYGNVSKTVQDAVRKSSTMDEEFEIVHAVEPNDDYIPGVMVSERKPFRSIYVEANAKKQDPPLRVSGYEENPYSVWRWDVNTYEWYGRGPGLKSLVDIQRLNVFGRTSTEAGELAVNPPIMAPWGHRGRVKIVPRGMNYYDNLAAERIMPVYTLGQYPITEKREAELREIINKHFMVDFFISLTQARSRMTAAEFFERQGELSTILGTVVGQLEEDFLVPSIERVYNIESRAGRLPPPPQGLPKGSRIKIELVGPMAQIQRRHLRTRGTMAGLAAMGNVFLVFPEARDYIDEGELIKDIHESYGMPQKVLRPEDDVEELRARRAAAQAQAQQADLITRLARGSGGIKAPEQGSLISMLSGANITPP